MSNPLELTANELFGGQVPDEARTLIEAARVAPRELTSSLLWRAQQAAPSCLPTYYLLYKSHASRGELEHAEIAALGALREAGLQSGLPAQPGLALSATLPATDFSVPGAARFWLFTLKALTFIRLRQGRVHDARALLDLVARCDPQHSVGSDVTAALVAAAEQTLLNAATGHDEAASR